MDIFGLYVYTIEKIQVSKYNNLMDDDLINQVIKTINVDITGYNVFSHENKAFHMLVKSNRILVLISVRAYPKRLGLKCLEELDTQLDSVKSPNLKKLVEKYNQVEQLDQLSITKAKVDQVKVLMHENINKALENQVKLESIELTSEELAQSAGIFNKTAKELRKRLWWKNIKAKLCIGFAVLAAIGIIVGVCIAINKTDSSK